MKWNSYIFTSCNTETACHLRKVRKYQLSERSLKQRLSNWPNFKNNSSQVKISIYNFLNDPWNEYNASLLCIYSSIRTFNNICKILNASSWILRLHNCHESRFIRFALLKRRLGILKIPRQLLDIPSSFQQPRRTFTL